MFLSSLSISLPTLTGRQSVLLGIVVLLAYRLEFTDTFPVHTQGFFCYDSTYAKPYPGPEATSRAPPALIYALVTAGPTLTVRLVVTRLRLWEGPSRRQEGRWVVGGGLGLKAKKTTPRSCPQILLGELARAFFPAPPSAVPIIGESTIVSGACCQAPAPYSGLVAHAVDVHTHGQHAAETPPLPTGAKGTAVQSTPISEMLVCGTCV